MQEISFFTISHNIYIIMEQLMTLTRKTLIFQNYYFFSMHCIRLSTVILIL